MDSRGFRESHLAKRGSVLLAVMVSEYPAQTRDLLRAHGANLLADDSAGRLIDYLHRFLETGDDDFLKDLTRLISLHLSEDEFNSFAGLDPISAVSSAVSSVGNIFSQGQRNKEVKLQTRQQTLQNYLAYQGMKKQLIAEEKRQVLKNKRNNDFLKVLGFMFLAGLSLFLLIKNNKP